MIRLLNEKYYSDREDAFLDVSKRPELKMLRYCRLCRS